MESAEYPLMLYFIVPIAAEILICYVAHVWYDEIWNGWD